ncbi:hypothetical protein P152DRAFT_479656 [Eremomyces bilateralis CBS 781.70]|uniref:Uncharacterized protein n=1 Tax=Eremomyces bilateralis CBS 781.70 TaxID=1392243 RepID=A0A6G1GCG3_9PEZI|nr:uncharacterized protein P152DRAFT_479656 [Eremomyces bilateralis CBS 781.70]KAF1815788.1 hypothetical protein P152DRAFT_479656 [Eremomyces bilateralis CBS 781.70]
MSPQPIDEALLFHPKDPNIVDENLYEEFSLSSVDIFSASHPTVLVSLFEADESSPVTVVGKLAPLNKREQHFLQHPLPSKDRLIQARNVRRFSFGQYLDGTLAFWALGSAGHFKLRPSANYKPLFDDMEEGCRILYFLVDTYKTSESSRVPARVPPQEVFARLAARYPQYAADAGEAMRKIYKHQNFLVGQMRQGRDGLHWGHTGIYQHLVKRPGSGLVQPSPTPATEQPAIKDRPSSTRQIVPRSTTTATTSRTSSSTPTTKAADMPPSTMPPADKQPDHTQPLIPKRRPGRPRKDRAKEWESAQTLWSFMRTAVRTRSIATRDITLAGFASAFNLHYDLHPAVDAAQYFLAHATALVSMMQLADDGIHGGVTVDGGRMRWTRTIVYRALVSEEMDAKTQAEVLGVEATPRAESGLVEAVNEQDERDAESSGAEEEVVVLMPKRNTRGRKSKSVLRPKASRKRYSGKGAATDVKDEEMDDGDVDATPPKRKGDEMDVDGDGVEHRRPSKRNKSIEPHLADMNLDYPSIPGADSSDDDDASTSPSSTPPPSLATTQMHHLATALTAALPLHRKPPLTDSISLFHPLLRAEPRPSTAPNAPGDAWQCTFSGCAHVVFGASTDDGVGLIEEHLVVHEGGIEERLGIIREEGGRVGMPVNNLLKRIRDLATQHAVSAAAEPSSTAGAAEENAPAPRLLRQRY